jgi:hypothetical protein
MISITHLYFYKHVFIDMGIYLIYLSKNKNKKHFKPKYLSNYLNSMNQKITKIWRCNYTKEKWSNNGLKNMLINNIIFEIYIWHFVIL